MSTSSLIFFSFFLLFFVAESVRVSRPNAFVLPVTRDTSTSLYVTQIHKRTPLTPTSLVVDLNGRFLWVNCEKNYLSSSYHVPMCRSTLCTRAGPHYCHTCSTKAQPGCHNNTCAVMAVNPVTRKAAISELAQDVISIQSNQGSKPGPLVTIPDFLFSCVPSSLLQSGVPKSVQGVAGLSHATTSLPNQLASRFGFQPVFATCLASSSNGVIFFGNGPYKLQPGIDVSQNLAHTPLTVTPTGEYSIQVTSVRINEKMVPLKMTRAFIPAIISTTSPFTILEHSLFTAITQFFTNQLSQVARVNPIAPFGVCFDSRKVSSTRTGPGVPNIDFVLHNRNTIWRLFGANSMVQARPGTLCLGFVDGGSNPRASIVIGGHQLEDNLLQFDLARSLLGFSSSLLFRRTTCANYNFNSTS